MDCPIDENGQVVLRLDSPDTSGHVRAQLYSAYARQSDLVKNILPLMSVETDQQTIKPSLPGFDIPGTSFTVKINNQPVVQCVTQQGKVDMKPLRRLSVFETRTIGRAWQDIIPAPIDAEHLDAPPPLLTDLHTHLSAQVAAHDLIELGRRYGVLYPTAALNKLHIKYSKGGLRQIPKRVFLPLAHLQSSKDSTEPAVPLSSLSPEALKSLEKALSLSPEGQSTFEAIETIYYMREPFTKDLRLLPDMLRSIAQEYKRQGIRYAELSSNAVLDPRWLEKIHEVVPEIERTTGVQLRFRPGLPRNLDDEAFRARVEQYKRIAASPYIVGPDILGYEINKTSRLQEHLKGLAHWMKEHQPEDSMQIHAGENAKNLTNVREALQLADEYGIRLHLGHALYGIDAETMKLAKKVAAKNDLIVQFNLDSNLAANNIDLPADARISWFIDEKVPCVLSSDGASMYLTSARQTALAGLHCGVTREGFKNIRATEEAYIARQTAVFERKVRELPGDFFAQLAAVPMEKRDTKPAAAVSKEKSVTEKLKKLIRAKRPILFAGAGGSSWNDVPAGIRQEFAGGLDRLLEQLDPDKIYFVKGRTKGSGVNIELEKAIARYNDSDAHRKKFACVTMLAESEEVEGHTSPNNYTLKLSVPLVFMPDNVIGFLKEHRGCAFYAGGKNFTRDFILASAQHDIPFGLMEDAKGASAEKARVYKTHAFRGVQGMVEYAAKIPPQIISGTHERSRAKPRPGGGDSRARD